MWRYRSELVGSLGYLVVVSPLSSQLLTCNISACGIWGQNIAFANTLSSQVSASTWCLRNTHLPIDCHFWSGKMPTQFLNLAWLTRDYLILLTASQELFFDCPILHYHLRFFSFQMVGRPYLLKNQLILLCSQISQLRQKLPHFWQHHLKQPLLHSRLNELQPFQPSAAPTSRALSFLQIP